MSSPMVEKRSIASLKFDEQNARAHTARNTAMIERSLQETGAGRSLLIASDGTVIAGNATLEAAASAGFEEVYVIKTDGSQLVVVQRDDLEAGSDQAIKLGLYDNRSGELAGWHAIKIAELQMTSPEMLEAMFSASEVEAILSQIPDLLTEALAEQDALDALKEDDFVAFKFGEYAGKVSKVVYEQFANHYEATKSESGAVMLDDVLSALMGL